MNDINMKETEISDQELTIDLMRNSLHNLNQMEMQEIDDIITPRAAELLAKAFGQGMWQILGPLIKDDDPDELKRSEESLQKMMRDPRYWREKDPETIRKVSQGFERLYPDNKTSDKIKDDDFIR